MGPEKGEISFALPFLSIIGKSLFRLKGIKDLLDCAVVEDMVFDWAQLRSRT